MSCIAKNVQMIQIHYSLFMFSEVVNTGLVYHHTVSSLPIGEWLAIQAMTRLAGKKFIIQVMTSIWITNFFSVIQMVLLILWLILTFELRNKYGVGS